MKNDALLTRLVEGLLVMLVMQALLASFGFILGIACSAWHFWISVFVAMCVIGFRRKLDLLVFIAMILSCCIMTMFTFTYNSADAQSCHVPIQRAIMGGWNPFWNCSVEGMLTALGLDSSASMRLTHALYAPKFVHYVGAVFAKGCGLWIGDAFAGWTLAVTLFIYSCSFARRYFTTGRVLTIVFQMSLLATSLFMLMFDGFVDFVLYAGMALFVLSFLMWEKCHNKVDVGVCVLSAVICMATKAAGLSFVFVFWLYFLFADRLYKSRWFWILTVVGALLVCVIGSSPFFTVWMSGDSSMGALTSDFIGNADAAKMGYLARISYAWFSTKITSLFCCWWYGQRSFNPSWEVSCCGKSALWTMLFLFSVVVLAWSKRWDLLAVCVLLFVTANAVPLKYIGYSRYCPQMGLIPILSLYALSDRKIGKWVVLLLIPYVLPTLLAVVVRYSYLISLERFRQDQISELKVRGDPIVFRGSSTFRARLLRGGLNIVADDSNALEVSVKPGGWQAMSCASMPAWDNVTREDMDLSYGLKSYSPKYLWRAITCPPMPIFEGRLR